VKGLVLWEAERPLLATPRELAGPRRATSPEPQPASATA
jgi:hypothetical protein